ncbi:hypothetical protein [Hydrogenobaculum acidophilum]
MNRREFIATTGLAVTTSFLGAYGFSTSDEAEKRQSKPKGPVTLYYEFKVGGPQIPNLIEEVNNYIKFLKTKNGFLSLSLKQMVGESTMVKNIDPSLKGVLRSAYVDAANHRLTPFYFYSLLIRFNNYDNLVNSGAKEKFKNSIVPHLYMYSPFTNPPSKTNIMTDYYQGIYKTIAAGDPEKIYKEEKEIVEFLRNQKDITNIDYKPIPSDGTSNGLTITVINHVSIHSANTDIVNNKATKLLEVAQTTYQPATNPHDGNPGSLTNNYYQKPLSTEILQNAYEANGMRDYLMHGIWKSVADHENSHLDIRFKKAFAPAGALAIQGPWEPFYQTNILYNNI